MSQDLAPLLVGFAAVGLLIFLIAAIAAVRRLFLRVRLRPRSHAGHGDDGWAAGRDWVSERRGRVHEVADTIVPRDMQATEQEQEAAREESAAIEGAERRVEEMLAAAAQQAESHLRESTAEATRTAQELIAAAERRSEALLGEAQTRAEREAQETTQGAWKQARKLLEKAELEAGEIVAAAERERGRLVDELARERALVEETRTRLSGFLVDVLEEVDGTSAPGHESTNVMDLNEAREIRTSAAADL